MLESGEVIGIGKRGLTSRHIQATKLMQPNMPDKDPPTSEEVVTAEAISTMIAAMTVG